MLKCLENIWHGVEMKEEEVDAGVEIQEKEEGAEEELRMHCKLRRCGFLLQLN